MKRKRFVDYKKTIMDLATTFDGVLGVTSLGMGLLAMAISPLRILRVAGTVFFVSLAAFLGIGIFKIRRDPKTKDWKLKRWIELPVVSKKRCVIFSCIPLALSILLFASLFFLQ